jgi:sulfate adenylyltransferase
VHHLIRPYGGDLVGLIVDDDRLGEIKQSSLEWPSCSLGARQICDLELLMNGALTPLSGYMGSRDHATVCAESRLGNGTLWPVPITLDVSAEVAESASLGGQIALRDSEGVMLAAVTVEEVWKPDRKAELEALFGTTDEKRPQVAEYLDTLQPYAIAGPVEGVQIPVHHDYRELRLTPEELRRTFARIGWRRVLAFQTHQTMHRAHHALTQRSALELGANLLIHPLVGHSRAGDPDHYTRVRCYQALLAHYPKDMARLNLLPLASRGAGAREAVLQAIVHRNYGCTHLMVEHDTGGSVLESVGAPAYDPEEARAVLDEHRDELEIEFVRYREMVYHEQLREMVPVDELPNGDGVHMLTGADIRRRLAVGEKLPDWYTFPGVERELRRRHPPRYSQGFTVFFTGLSGAGKSTIANALRVKLMELGDRGVTLLDGDLVRRNLSSELGFSREHRDLNILRIGFVAAEITRAGGVAICAPIAPYDAVRRRVRATVEPWGGFVLVYVATPLEVCEQRDRKGMYAKARAGIVKEFTGISDPYEVPTEADVVIDASGVTPEEATREVLLFLEREGYISAASSR